MTRSRFQSHFLNKRSNFLKICMSKITYFKYIKYQYYHKISHFLEIARWLIFEIEKLPNDIYFIHIAICTRVYFFKHLVGKNNCFQFLNLLQLIFYDFEFRPFFRRFCQVSVNNRNIDAPYFCLWIAQFSWVREVAVLFPCHHQNHYLSFVVVLTVRAWTGDWNSDALISEIFTIEYELVFAAM